MNDAMFMKRMFHGYIRNYAALRWHVLNNYADMTSLEISYFSKLGTLLGYVPVREYADVPPAQHHYANKSNPRDLVWLNLEENKVILHLERENESSNYFNAVRNVKNKLLDSAQFPEDRYLVGVFGWVTDADYSGMIGFVANNNHYQKKNVMFISYIGPTKNEATQIVCDIFPKGSHERCEAWAELDKGGYWYAHFGPAPSAECQPLPPPAVPRWIQIKAGTNQITNQRT
ncbi:hypothetical protein [Fundidesulfovibrio soli]|uniref:hypothetical protein n=1 Tax=Fundidesulfovibrio soli TaxID=2922716 RepID=UPI001FB00B33|nr:hypothetical protein [Fundidesulfovibrio soli]